MKDAKQLVVNPIGLTRLDDGTDGPWKLDIIALHGINGHAKNSWADSNGHFWLQDQIPQMLPGARVFTFGYPAKVVFQMNTAGLEEFSRTLLHDVRLQRAGKRQVGR
jgi:hypothetical protein